MMQSRTQRNYVPGTLLLALAALQACAVDVDSEPPRADAVESEAFSVPNESPAMEHYAPDITQAIATWATTYDLSDDCDPYALRVAPADDSVLERVCGRPGLLGCTAVLDRTNAVVLIHAAEGNPRNTLTHEAMHWLSYCSGTYADAQSDHDDPLIWGKGGVLARTNASLGLPHD